jgi:glutathione S-transferase
MNLPQDEIPLLIRKGPSKSWSPNTLKTRLALNYKRIPYKQSFISYPDIAPVLKSLSVPPKAHGSGRPFTLPAIIDPKWINTPPSGALMDSFLIALHLDQHYPSPPLFPSEESSRTLALAVRKLMLNVVAPIGPLQLPEIAKILDPRGRDYFIETRSQMFGKPLMSMVPTDSTVEDKMIRQAVKEMDIIVVMLQRNKLPGATGCFLEGRQVSYADFIIVAVLAWLHRGRKDIWRKLLQTGDGEVERLWDACQPWLEGQGEDVQWEDTTTLNKTLAQ